MTHPYMQVHERRLARRAPPALWTVGEVVDLGERGTVHFIRNPEAAALTDVALRYIGRDVMIDAVLRRVRDVSIAAGTFVAVDQIVALLV